MKSQFVQPFILTILILMISCSGGNSPTSTSDCDAPVLTITSTTGTACGSSDGTIAATASGGEGRLTFRIDGSNFNESGVFSNLPSGVYTVAVRDENNCSSSEQVTIITGISFTASIKPIIDNNCAVSGCHVGGGLPDFRVFSNIQSRASDIKSRTSNRIMPPPSSGRSLTDNQIEKIACWVDDGAPNN